MALRPVKGGISICRQLQGARLKIELSFCDPLKADIGTVGTVEWIGSFTCVKPS